MPGWLGQLACKLGLHAMLKGPVHKGKARCPRCKRMVLTASNTGPGAGGCGAFICLGGCQRRPPRLPPGWPA